MPFHLLGHTLENRKRIAKFQQSDSNGEDLMFRREAWAECAVCSYMVPRDGTEAHVGAQVYCSVCWPDGAAKFAADVLSRYEDPTAPPAC